MNYFVDEGLSSIGVPDIAHPELISRSIFYRLDPDLQVGIPWSDCSRFNAYMFRFNAFGVCLALPNKYGLALDEIYVRGLRSR